MGRYKLRERFMLGVAGSVILLTMFLIIDLQMDLGVTSNHLPMHGKVKYSALEDGNGAVYNSFRRKFLQKANASKESQQTEMPDGGKLGGLDVGKSATKSGVVEKHDPFVDLQEFVDIREREMQKAAEYQRRGVSNPTLKEILSLVRR